MDSSISSVKCVGDYLYICKEWSIVRYRPYDTIFSGEEVLNFDASIDKFLTFKLGCLVITGEESQNAHYYYFSHKTFKPIELKLPYPLENP